MCARLSATFALALDRADPKPVSDETVQVDTTGHHVTACIDGTQVRSGERLGVDQGQVLPDPPLRGKRALSRGVAIAVKPAPRDRPTPLNTMGGPRGQGCDDDGIDDAKHAIGATLQIEVVRCHDEAADDRFVVERTVEWPRRGAEHDARPTASSDRDPVSRPREARGVIDREQTKALCGKPLPQPLDVVKRGERPTEYLLDGTAQCFGRGRQ